MEPITEIRIPLLWNANGFIEVIKEDYISEDEAERVIRLFKRNISSDSDEGLPPAFSSSSEHNVDCGTHQEKFILKQPINDEQISTNCLVYLPRKNQEIFDEDSVNKELYIQGDNSLLDEKEKYHACELCGKRFSRKFNLNTHIKCVHSDDKDYICSFCNRAFNHSSNLRKHIKTVHSSEKPFCCPMCQKAFKHVGAMRGHIRVIHGVRDGL